VAPHESHSAASLSRIRQGTAQWAPHLVPGITWIKQYRRRDLPYDMIAGLTVAAVIVPIGMAYGQLSGLPPIIGLYASLLPLVAYALFGSSRQLIIGPNARAGAPGAAPVISAPLQQSHHESCLWRSRDHLVVRACCHSAITTWRSKRRQQT
jgi:MFS superfamily sulfate permease-like transporter